MSFRNNRTKDIQTDKENERKRKLDRTSHEEDIGKEKQNKKKQKLSEEKINKEEQETK